MYMVGYAVWETGCKRAVFHLLSDLSLRSFFALPREEKPLSNCLIGPGSGEARLPRV